MKLVKIIYISVLFWGVLLAWYDPMLICRGLLVVFTVLLEIFYWGVFYHLVWFVCFVGFFSVTPSSLIGLESSECLYHWRAWRPLSIRSASSDALALIILVDTCSLGQCSSPGEFRGLLKHSIMFVLIQIGCFCHPLFLTSLLGTAWTSPWSLWNRNYLFLT